MDQGANQAGPKSNHTALGCGCLGVVAIAVIVFLVVAVNTGNKALSGSSSTTDAAPAPTPATGAPSQAAATQAAATQAAPSVTTSDNPTFDLTGSGDACRMHYFDQGGQTVTLFTLTEDGEVITHVSDSAGNINRNDVHWTRGVNRLTYDFPLTQATDIGAVLYLPDGSSQSCTISAGTDAP